MSLNPLTLNEDYWETFELQDDDIDFLYNHLLEIEKPLTSEDLLDALIGERISIEKERVKQQIQGETKVYLPKDEHQVGEKLVFPSMNWQKGEILNVRTGFNPEVPQFNVMEVKLESGKIIELASSLQVHKLNDPVVTTEDDLLLNKKHVLKTYGENFVARINDSLSKNPDLVCIADHWFPTALLVDVNIGYLNLAEALLDMENGGPLNTQKILAQIDLPTDVSNDLTEFSLNFALQEDARFDEVGAAGEVLWFLRRLEPENVREKPKYLQCNSKNVLDREEIAEFLEMIDSQVIDELEVDTLSASLEDEIAITMIFPHWMNGSLPLNNQNYHIFPSAFESPRVRFTFVDEITKEKFSGWVVRPFNYVYGLKDWFDEHGIIPGSIIRVRRGTNPGEVIINSDKRRTTKEWVRTALVGADEKIVFAMLKQQISSNYDERMVVYISDADAIIRMWESNKYQNLEKNLLSLMRELVKINPQGNVHFQELYAAINIIQRCPPSEILSLLMKKKWAVHLGDLYFKLDTSALEDKSQ